MSLRERSFLLAALLLAALAACTKPKTEGPARSEPTARSRQLLLVTVADWNAPQGTLRRYARAGADSWQPVGSPIPVVVGRAGLAWGRGLHGEQAGPLKREGDGRAPAGVFKLSATFGYEPDPPGNLPHHHATEQLLCIDDPASIRYNKLLDRAQIQHPDWSSAEQMRRADDQYRLGVVVEHNTNPVEPGRGSCIFLHVWAGADQPTSGCTAMQPEAMRAVARWLDWMAEPILVQLPSSEYQRLRASWKLPAIAP